MRIMNVKKFVIFFLIIVVGIFPFVVCARIGVGVTTGKIEVHQLLKPGEIYELPSLGVFNNGDESGDYEVEITYHSQQPQHRPAKEWFSFSPSLFSLEPGGSKAVAIKLTLPLETEPGDYFAYLEAHPVVKAGPGTTIGIAAAAKLYFKVVPANIWQAIGYRISSFFSAYSPWSWVVLAVLLGATMIIILKKYFAFQIGIKIRKKEEKKETEKEIKKN